MLYKTYILICLVGLYLVSCTTPQPDNFQVYVTDTSINHLHSNEIEASKLRSTVFNLPLIINGVDSFELRIWIQSMILPQEFFILRHAPVSSRGKWFATKTYYDLDSSMTKNIELPKDIDNLVKYLSKKEILELPSQGAIPGFLEKRNSIADGQSFFIEIATSKFYKALDYSNPEFFSDSEPNNKKFLEIVAHLNTYFNFYRPMH